MFFKHIGFLGFLNLKKIWRGLRRGGRRLFVGLASPCSPCRALLLWFLLCKAQLQTLDAHFCWCPKWLSLGALTCCGGWRLSLSCHLI